MKTDGKQINEMLGSKVRVMRKNLHLTQIEVAEELSLNNKTISRYERGERTIPLDIFYQMMTFFQEKEVSNEQDG